MKSLLPLILLVSIAQLPHLARAKPEPKPIYFIAMEYKGMSNCIYKVYITDSLVFGAKVNGYITVEPTFGMGTSIPKDKMHDPEAYVNKKMDKYDDLLADHAAFLGADKDNFIIERSAITKVYHNPNKKSGMGYYPHAGRIEIETIKTKANRKGDRELILVGDQNPDQVLSLFK